ncbi:DDE_3 domain-containing protein [Trichonephila clavipes]|nr:DDE_3 domain-containing protein [Trichonephila clavipes]
MDDKNYYDCKTFSGICNKTLLYYGVQPLQNSSLYTRGQFECVPLNRRQRFTFFVWQQNICPKTNSNGHRFSSDTCSGSHWVAIQEVCRSGGNNTTDTINPTLSKDTVGGIIILVRISLGGHLGLHNFHGGALTGVRYRDEILD